MIAWQSLTSDCLGSTRSQKSRASSLGGEGRGGVHPSSIPRCQAGARCAMLDRASRKWQVETWLCLHQTIPAQHGVSLRDEGGLELGKACARERGEKLSKDAGDHVWAVGRQPLGNWLVLSLKKRD